MCPPLDYKQAGVDIELGNELVDEYKSIVQSTHNPSVLSQLGGFSALYDLSNHNLKQPVLVSATDGVGTKLRLALNWQQHAGVGIDLVAMCVNDLVVIGAKPLFFLDYYASGQLDKTITLAVVKSIAEGCQQAGMALIGGETAEMPGIYQGKDYDLAGFCVGIVDKQNIIDGRHIQPGDKLIALPSSGVHSNGFSLVRKIIDENKCSASDTVSGRTLKDSLLTPTRIYAKALTQLAENKLFKGAAHITGGGLTENIPRMLPSGLSAYIDTKSWSYPPIFQWLQDQAQMRHSDMRLTFNCGVGMVLCVAKADEKAVLEALEVQGEKPWVIGHIVTADNDQPIIFADGE